MSNLWKYASYNQRERAKMIKDGNQDVYTTEKARNKIVREANKKLGLSTSNIDAWDDYIDNLNTASKKTSLPKFMSTRQSNINNEYNSRVKSYKKEYEQTSEQAIDDAISASEYNAEALINKGYSSLGSTYKKTKESIEKDLEEELESLAKDFSEKVKNARAKYLSML